MFDHPFLQRLRDLAATLPDAGEKLSWGHPNFTAGGRMFAAFGIYQGRPRMGIATSLEEQAFLTEDPRFQVASYVGKYGWVSVWLDMDVEWDLLEELLRGAHARILAKAPRRPGSSRAKAPSKPARGKPAGTRSAGSKSAGSRSTGGKPAGSRPTGSKTSGSKTSGSKSAGSRSAGAGKSQQPRSGRRSSNSR